ncbi:hypothetical protein [Domibacillus aminovorans]|uniref:Extracellular protein n=1 Tax=Domibacillus aminovorans TaxID=29332 RepID=A0A177LBH6_9BACI|nr:hypothetical protein [Domibacillus aminovorans]OAH63160.1 hypothetical protein AWH49_06280 [Domibacillus aminovorans]
MKKWLLSCLLFVFVLSNLNVLSVGAYTYGDPNEEALAEAYKAMMLELNKNPADYATAKKHFETVKEEVDMHMGPEPAKIILQNLEDEDKERVIENMDQLLVLNMARRLENIEKNFTEYDTSKRLLAKAHATYEALSPKVESRNPELDKEVKAEFDQALKALGNPGLFGVGKQEADLDQFNASKEKILTSLQKEFDLKSLEIGHFSESATEKENGKNEWTDVSNIRNWIPLLLIVGLLIAVIVVARRKRKK